MTNKDYETDNSMFKCNDEADFQSFIEEREQASECTEATVREMKIEAATAFSPKGTISEASRREASFLVKHPHIGELYLRDISVSSLLERARIGRYALGELSRDDFAYVVTKCLETAKINDMTKIRVQEGKRRLLWLQATSSFLSLKYSDRQPNTFPSNSAAPFQRVCGATVLLLRNTV